jgi:hypothetical protein
VRSQLVVTEHQRVAQRSEVRVSKAFFALDLGLPCHRGSSQAESLGFRGREMADDRRLDPTPLRGG